MSKFGNGCGWWLGVSIVTVVCGLWGGSSGRALAAERDPRVQTAINKGMAFLRKEIGNLRGGRKSLAALALIKGGDSPTSPAIQQAIRDIQAKVKDGEYAGPSSEDIVYVLGVDLNVLVEADHVQYEPEIKALTNKLIALQFPDGSWDYPHKRTVGDTSMTQYAMLGFWAAERAGVPVPKEVYQKAVAWHGRTQLKNGGFAYHPGTPDGPERGAPTLSMTAAGTSSLLIARMYLRPAAPPGAWEENPTAKPKAQTPKAPEGPKFGVLEQVDLDTGKKKVPSADEANVASFDAPIARSLGWLNANFRDRTTNPHFVYYYYTLERMAALANITKIGGNDWFTTCANALIPQQAADGSWKPYEGTGVGTSLAVMFLSKASAKTLGRRTADPVGGGLLAGGRGLPTDLSSVQVKGGEIVKQPEAPGPLDELLGQLQTAQPAQLAAVQESIIKKVQLGDRETLIGQRERLLELVEHPNVDVRRTALWALGRSGKLDDVPLLMRALEDTNIDVVIEARNALCWVARKPRGFGMPETPLETVDEDASDAEKEAAIRKWRTEVLKRWGEWFQSTRPYELRDRLFELQLSAELH